MTIAATVQRYLRDCGIDYEIVEHARTLSSSRTAQAGHVSGDRLAKAVVLKSEGGFTMAVLPTSRHLRLGEIQDYLDARSAWRAGGRAVVWGLRAWRHPADGQTLRHGDDRR
jgi:prolyl-tRNA editing enzyme YbaK/EbsC (Cys-tRNA(Pro) deacylase)